MFACRSFFATLFARHTDHPGDRLRTTDIPAPDSRVVAASTDERGGPTANARRRFIWVAAGSTLIATTLLWLIGLVMNDGHFLYAFDDTAIHLSIVRQLLGHGTWGVSSGVYASASSSPGWTLLLAALTAVLPFARNVLPLLMNVAAGIWLIRLFAREQSFLLPRARDWLGLALTVVLAVVLWFVPGLALLGMEHILHAALVVQALVLLQRLQSRRLTPRECRPYLLVLLLATLIRYESAFLAVGCALAIVCVTTARLGNAETVVHWTRRRARRLAGMSLIVSALPILVFAAINKSFGDGFLPNSVEAKTALQRTAGLGVIREPKQLMMVLTSDPAVLVLLVLAMGYVLWAWSGGPRRHTAIALAFVVTTLLHAELANFGWHERYQAYLVIAGSYVALQIASEVVAPARRSAALALGVLLIFAFSITRIGLLIDTPRASSNTYRQRYQMGLFLKEYYNGRGFLTGELGYTTYLHDGPVVDILGLGTHEVLAERQRHGVTLSEDFVRNITRRNNIDVMTFYGLWPGFKVPREWVLVGEWQLKERKISVPDTQVQFYAPDERGAVELERNLRAFAPRLPSRVEVLYRGDLISRFLQTRDDK